MIKAYRICKTKYATTAFDGEGAFRAGGRWSSQRTRIVYVAESLALAVLEILVHFQDDSILSSYSFIEIEFDDVLVESVEKIAELPEGWNQSPPPFEIRQIGDDWVKRKSSAVLKVPSAIIPAGSNYLINPRHPDFSRIKIGNPQNFTFDERLLKTK